MYMTLCYTCLLYMARRIIVCFLSYIMVILHHKVMGFIMAKLMLCGHINCRVFIFSLIILYTRIHTIQHVTSINDDEMIVQYISKDVSD